MAITYRILPESTDIDFGSLTASVKDLLGAKLVRLSEKPIAFGLKALEAIVLLDDASGEGSAIESALYEISGVSSVETQDISLV